ncbi:unnamed protein product [Allacma fusca]|uniref:Uncharacterized protein n=1 Tax=Allacma fusca TaxID=39272 RepID=A0A8J2LM36_9HEXA|nr:unnamed protein product [Allacma fusca]
MCVFEPKVSTHDSNRYISLKKSGLAEFEYRERLKKNVKNKFSIKHASRQSTVPIFITGLEIGDFKKTECVFEPSSVYETDVQYC